MKSFARFLMTGAAIVTLAFQPAPASSASSSTGTKKITSLKVSSSHDPLSSGSGSDDQQGGSSRNRQHDPSSAPTASQRPRPASIATLHRELVEREKQAARDKAEVDARANRIYATSQVSAPIITDARACKRVGPNGESIYENC